MNSTSMNKIIAFLSALLLSFGFAACCLNVPALSGWISARGNINLLTYALQIVLFCLLFMIFYVLLPKNNSLCSYNPAAMTGVLILTLLTLVFLIKMFRLEIHIFGGVSSRYIWHKLPFWLVFLFLAGEILFLFFIIRESSLKIPQPAMYLLYGILTAVTAYCYYTPDYFVRGYSDRLHADAYYNSIYNVMHGSPYTENATSIYGHYGILFKLPMKILGGDFIDYIFLLCLLGGLCTLAMCLALHFTVKNNLLRILGAVSLTLPVLSMRGGYYWQLWPHRILFMSLLLCFGAVCVHFGKLNRITCLVGYLISLLGVLWNTESGIFCAVAWAGFWILLHLCEKKWKFTSALRTVILHLAGIVLCFLGAWGLVNLYNIACGGSINSIREFLFPLMNNSYMTDLLRVDLTQFPSAYMAVIGLLFLAAAWGISHMAILNKNLPSSPALAAPACFAFCTSVLTMGQMSYYMNRAAYHNLDISHMPCILLICILTERGMHFIKKFRFKDRKKFSCAQLFQGAFTAVNLGLLLALATGTMVQSGYNLELKEEFRDKEEIHYFAGTIASAIPENTYAFGIGVPEIYSMIRWDTGCYTLDFADLSVRPSVADYVIQDIKEKEIPGFLTGEETMKKLERFASDENRWIKENYELSREFTFQGAVFEYYTKK